MRMPANSPLRIGLGDLDPGKCDDGRFEPSDVHESTGETEICQTKLVVLYTFINNLIFGA